MLKTLRVSNNLIFAIRTNCNNKYQVQQYMIPVIEYIMTVQQYMISMQQ